MLDLAQFPNNSKVNTQMFMDGGQWQTWIKPRGAKLVNIVCVGGGGGGGGGNISQSATPSGVGGGGGACGGITRLTIEASTLPDLLYVYPGQGGTGGTGTLPVATTGSSGEISYIAFTPSSTPTSNLICASSATVAPGGTINGVTSGTPAAATAASAIFFSLSNTSATAGIGGASGGSVNQAGTNIAPNLFITPGCGGGGTSTTNTARNGGQINGAAPYLPIVTGGVGTAVLNATGGNGNDGIVLYKPFLYLSGGSGGGNSSNASGTTNTGGNGGNGAPGCGGGGGGAGINQGGRGGKGGDGLIIITTYLC